jgi:hypothetical protein
MGYCDPADLYLYGLPRGAAPSIGRLAGSVSTSVDTIEVNAHGFSLNDTLTFRAEAGGSLPSPLVSGTTYYAVPVDDSHFKVASAADGAAINLTTAGSRIVVVAALSVDGAIDWASRVIDDMVPAHVVPLDSPYPEIVRMTCAELAAGKMMAMAGTVSKSLMDITDAANKRIERWAKHVPIRGTNAPAPANLAASATLPYADARGWSTYGGL